MLVLCKLQENGAGRNVNVLKYEDSCLPLFLWNLGMFIHFWRLQTGSLGLSPLPGE